MSIQRLGRLGITGENIFLEKNKLNSQEFHRRFQKWLENIAAVMELEEMQDRDEKMGSLTEIVQNTRGSIATLESPAILDKLQIGATMTAILKLLVEGFSPQKE